MEERIIKLRQFSEKCIKSSNHSQRNVKDWKTNIQLYPIRKAVTKKEWREIVKQVRKSYPKYRASYETVFQSKNEGGFYLSQIRNKKKVWSRAEIELERDTGIEKDSNSRTWVCYDNLADNESALVAVKVKVLKITPAAE